MEKLEKIRELDVLIEVNEELFYKEFKSKPDFSSTAPGRINVIGEHTDYNFGLSMPAAINRWVIITFSARDDKIIQIKSLNFDSSIEASLDDLPDPKESWQTYILGSLKIFSESFPFTKGFNALIWGNVPLQSGVSSSAALEVAMMNGLRALYGAELNDLEIVKRCQQVEHQYLKVKSGLLDQYASQFSTDGKVMVVDLNSMQHQYVSMKSDKYDWVLVESGVTRELAHSGYTQRVKETSEALDFLKGKIHWIKNLRDVKEEYLDLIDNVVWKKRLEHYLSENKRVINAMDYIQNNDLESLGKVINKSHQSLKDLYEVSCQELDFLAMAAQSINGCLGSRMMGGGFGGCTLNLVHKDTLNDFKLIIEDSYLKRFNRVPPIDHYTIVGGATIYNY